MIPLLVVRPEPGCSATVVSARALGLTALGHPLFAVGPVAWQAPDPSAFDALLVGSANVFRHGGEQLADLRGLPVRAVGESTAEAAREAGFAVQATGSGGLQPVLDAVPAGTRLLRLAGAERVVLSPPPGVTLTEVVVYASEPLPMESRLAATLREPCVVALHSGTAARHFAAECDRLGVDRAGVALVTIGPRVSAAAGAGWQAVATAPASEDAAMLATARNLCHTTSDKDAKAMPEDTLTEPPAVTPPPASVPSRTGGSGRTLLAGAVIAFALGAGLVGYANWRGFAPWNHEAAAPKPVGSQPASAGRAPDLIPLQARQSDLETRMGLIEQRLDAASARADAASGNASRAEALLVAAAARRAVDRGMPLGYLEDQLRLRFGNSQPSAVATVIEAGRQAVTLDQLVAGLDSLSSQLTRGPDQGNAWDRVKQQVSSLFVIRRESAPSPRPQMVLRRARLLLEAGRTSEAVDAVERLPGAAEAREWLIAARRYDEVQRALDSLDTAALLDTRGLRDAAGHPVNQSPPSAPLDAGGN